MVPNPECLEFYLNLPGPQFPFPRMDRSLVKIVAQVEAALPPPMATSESQLNYRAINLDNHQTTS